MRDKIYSFHGKLEAAELLKESKRWLKHTHTHTLLILMTTSWAQQHREIIASRLVQPSLSPMPAHLPSVCCSGEVDLNTCGTSAWPR